MRRAIELSKNQKVTWKNSEVTFSTADEPSNIEFANKFQSNISLFMKKLIVFIL